MEEPLKAILSLLGIAKKAGKTIAGNTAIKMALNKRQIQLLILSSDISETNKNKFALACEQCKIPFLVLGNKFDLGLCVGRQELMALGITDLGFAQAILKHSTKLQ